LLCAVLGLPALAGNNPAKLKAKVRSTSEKIVTATIEKDWEEMLSYYTDDAVSMPNYEEILIGKKAIAEYQEGMRRAGVTFHSMEFDIVDIWTARGLIYDMGTFGISLTIPGLPGPIEDRGKYLTVWQKRPDGSLKIKAEIWNSDFSPWQSQPGSPPAEVSSTPGRCPHGTQQCLNEQARKLKGRGVIGVDGRWDENGYRIASFAEGTTARSAGVRPGDLLVEVNGIPLSNQEAYAADAVNRLPGREVTITVLRDGAKQTMTVTLMHLTEKMMAEEIGQHLLAYHVD
jgi:ketosteroid isomerase-like protein